MQNYQHTDSNTPHIHSHTRVRVKETVIPILIFGIVIAFLAGAIGYTIGFYAGEKQGESIVVQRLKQPQSFDAQSPTP